MSKPQPPLVSDSTPARKPAKPARLTMDSAETDELRAGGFFQDMYDWCREKAGYNKDP